jgi:hypothetical protein
VSPTQSSRCPGLIVAVVGTGYDSDHADLAGALWTNPNERCGSADTDGNGKAGDCHGWNFARDGRTSVLDGALTYTDAPLEQGPGEAQDGPDGPDGSGDGADGSGDGPGGEDGNDDSGNGSDGSQEPVDRSGPNDERLVRTKFAGLGSGLLVLLLGRGDLVAIRTRR